MSPDSAPTDAASGVVRVSSTAAQAMWRWLVGVSRYRKALSRPRRRSITPTVVPCRHQRSGASHSTGSWVAPGREAAGGMSAGAGQDVGSSSLGDGVADVDERVDEARVLLQADVVTAVDRGVGDERQR